MIKEETYLEKTIDKDGVPLITMKKRLTEAPEYIQIKRPSACVMAKCVGCCSISDMEYIARFNRSAYECPFYKYENKKDYGKIIKLCEFAKEATNLDDDYSKGMRAAFEYIIKCIKEDCIK